MDLTLTRILSYQDGLFGVLHVYETGQQIAVTLEHLYDNSPKLPEGKYTCQRGIHRLKDLIPFYTYEVTNVPDHFGILFHVGNYPSESEGCILIGKRIYSGANGPLMITDSKFTFNKFMQLQQNSDTFQLTVRNQIT